MKKTIFVIYTNVKKPIGAYDKRYAFNTESDVKEGDMLKSDNYKTNLQVVKVLDKAFKYFNRETGELADTILSTNQFEVRDMKIIDPVDAQGAIIAERIPEIE